MKITPRRLCIVSESSEMPSNARDEFGLLVDGPLVRIKETYISRHRSFSRSYTKHDNMGYLSIADVPGLCGRDDILRPAWVTQET